MCDKNVKANLFVQKIKLKVRYIIWKKIKWDKKTKCIIRRKKKAFTQMDSWNPGAVELSVNFIIKKIYSL